MMIAEPQSAQISMIRFTLCLIFSINPNEDIEDEKEHYSCYKSVLECSFVENRLIAANHRPTFDSLNLKIWKINQQSITIVKFFINVKKMKILIFLTEFIQIIFLQIDIFFTYNFILSMEAVERSLIDYLEIPYEFRTHSQHNYIASQLRQIDPILFDENKVFLLSFFAQIVTPTLYLEAIKINSIILSTNISEHKFKVTKVVAEDLLGNFCTDQEVILLRAIDLQKCQFLSGKNIEAEVKQIHSWPIFCQIQKKKLYDIFRYCRIVSLGISQIFYREGDSIQNEYFFVRQGQFSFLYRDPVARKNVELLSVREGFIFNQDANIIEEETSFYGQLSQKQIVLPKFNYTVKCKSSQGVIYCINSDCFNKLVANVCENQLKEYLERKLTYLQERVQKVQRRRSSTANLLSQPPPRIQSAQLLPFTAPIRSFSRQVSKKQEQIIALNFNDKPCNYKTVRQSLPKRDRIFSKKQLKKLYPDPEQDQSGALMWKKAKCQRLKELSRPTTTTPSRSEILFQFTQTAILFEKHKKRLSVF